ncbi:hypothetical protein JHN61_20260 [Streptomyces sp. MBT67]|uniref:hypothetical protein n=1 Tax=Streptomyces TaxID=1883 RepID=UPI000BF0B6EA|nr:MULTISPECIES: hypothetical protein [unclassified Streptomyces]MBK3528786.1 hypothetical protein [Streptomyces sp. MBT72]MBK3538522.1 hypothetical protein [Streptomyces sp. MBT67]MBK3549216.1 hypothetical protein [Streptomyces sp. MBT61]MBK6027409.1 hypothetical protein [Streptomyces sp. MBT59]
MNDLPEGPFDSGDSDDSEDAEVRPGPLWRHAVWVVAVTAAGVALGWVGALFRIGPEEFGLPPAAPGALWPYLLAWAAIGLALAAVLRVVAAKVPVHEPETAAIGVVMIGTRLSLGWRPEPLEVAGLAAAGLLLVAVWCAVALRGAAVVRRTEEVSRARGTA